MNLKQRTPRDRSSKLPRPVALVVLLTALWTLFSAVELVPGAGAAGLGLGGAASTATSAVSNAASTTTSTAVQPAAPAPAPTPPAPSTSPAPAPAPAQAVAPVVNAVAQVKSEATAPSPPPSTPDPPQTGLPSAQPPAPKLPAAVEHGTSAAGQTVNSVTSHVASTTGRDATPTIGLPPAPLPKQPSQVLPSVIGSVTGAADQALPKLPVIGSILPAINSIVPPTSSIVPVVGALTGAAGLGLDKILAPVNGVLPAILDPVENVVPNALAPIKSAIPALSGIGKLIPPLPNVIKPLSQLPSTHLPHPAISAPGTSPSGAGLPGGGAGVPPAGPPAPGYNGWLQTPQPAGDAPDLIGLTQPAFGNQMGFLATLANPFAAPGWEALTSSPGSPPIEPGNGPQDSPSAPLPTPPGTTSTGGGFGGSLFIPLVALMALVGLSAPAIMRRLREAAALPAPTPFVCALERPG